MDKVGLQFAFPLCFDHFLPGHQPVPLAVTYQSIGRFLAYMDLPRNTIGFHPCRRIDCVTKQLEPRFLPT